MAPIKFEEDIRERLEKRQFQPSVDAWKKLSNRLDTEPISKKKTSYWWLGIAASFVGLIIVSSILFSKGSGTTIIIPELVEEEAIKGVEDKEGLKDSVVEVETIQENQLVLEEPEREEKNQEQELIPINSVVVKPKNDQPLVMDQHVMEDATTKVPAFQTTTIAKTANPAKTNVEQKVDEVVAQIQKLKEEKSAVTDAEIDALLQQAQKELTSKRLIDASTKTVDADLLLMQVEKDLDRSFRNRVFEALNSSYKKVRTAVAERNN